MRDHLSKWIWVLATLALVALCAGCSPPERFVLTQDTIYGTVVDDAGPVAAASVRIKATDNVTTTADDGSFTLGGLSASVPVSVTAWSGGYFVGWTTAAPSSDPITITIKPHYTSDNPDYGWFSMEAAEGSKSCGQCMPSYPEWETDAHSRSAVNPRFLTLFSGTDVQGNANVGFGFQTDRDRADFPAKLGNCAACHIPAADPNADPHQVTGIAAEGVFCEFCHKIGDVTLDPATDLPYLSAPGVLSMRLYRPEEGQQLFFGNFDDVTRRVSYLPLEEESAFCAPCHFGGWWGTLAYNSYGEWLDSPYSDPETGQTCQDCHMPVAGYDYLAYPDKGGLIRDPDRIFSHLMPGAANEEFLRETVVMTTTATQGADGLLVEVAITNATAGHHVPTDSPLRNMILLVQASDEQGQPLDYVGHQTVPEWGGRGDPGEGNYAGLPGKGFAKVLGDADGNAPAPQWRSTEIIYDTRIPALATDRSSYVFAAPKSGRAQVEAQLIFRRAFKTWADEKGWNDSDIIMAHTETEAAVVEAPVLVDMEPRYDTTLFAPSPATTATGLRLQGSDFASSDSCTVCHTEVHSAWQSSGHGQAADNDIYRGWLMAAIKATEGGWTRTCAACHTPAGLMAGQVKVERQWRGFVLQPYGPVAREGIACGFCHTIAATTAPGDGAYVSDPTGVYRTDMTAAYHEGVYSRDFYRSSEFCAICHEAQHPDNGLPLMTTYSEWRDGPYNSGKSASARTCQDCHQNGHGSVGLEQLLMAAELELVAPDTVPAGGRLDVQVHVRNVGAGHSLPTGSTELRQMWLDLTVADAAGTEVFRSGTVDEYGDPDEEAVRYGTVWLDQRGAPTVRMWEATEVFSDHRVPAQGLVTETFSVMLPGETKGPLSVEATLKYRRISGYYAGILTIIADSEGIDAPVVEMAQSQTSINVGRE